MTWEETDLFSECCRSSSDDRLYLDSAVQKEIPLCERHDGEKMREGADSFIFEKERHMHFLVLHLQIFCSFILT